MSLGRSSRFYFLGLAKMKSEKVLSSFASASSITIHHGSKLFTGPLTRMLVKPWWMWKMLKFLRVCSDTRLYPRYQLECASRLPSCAITIAPFPIRVCHFFKLFRTIVCELPQDGIKSFNDLWIKSNSFCHSREYFYESPPKVSRYGIMAIISSQLWNHAPYSKHGIVAY